MMNKLLLAAFLLVGACIDNGPTDTNLDLDSDVKADPAVGEDSGSTQLSRTDGSDVSVCDQVVATDGPCAVVCDPLKLSAFIPTGTCVTFLCDLEDGTQYKTGGCNQ